MTTGIEQLDSRTVIPKSGANGRQGFTLVELLVVIGIIAVLISVLLPVMSRVRERANQVKCASNVRQLCMVQIMYANENRGIFLDVGNGDHTFDAAWPEGTGVEMYLHWLHCGAKDLLTHTYKVPRNSFYCPSNQDLNTDANWSTAVGSAATGYVYFGGQSRLAKKGSLAIATPSIYLGLEETQTSTLPVMPRRQGQKSFYNVLVTDLNRGYFSSMYGSNHIRTGVDNGFMPRGPSGGNVGYVDGHVDWRRQTEMGQSATAYVNKRQIWQYAGGDFLRYYW